MTKTALLTASAIAALAFAGAANAGTLTAEINGVAANAATPYTIASERNDAADQTPAGGLVLTNVFSAKPSIAVAAPTKTYEIKIDVTNGTIPSAATLSLAINQTAAGGTPGAATCAISLRSETSVTFLCDIGAPTGAASVIDGFTLTGVVANSAAEGNISFASSVNDVTGGTLVSTIDTTAATRLVAYSPVVLSLSTTSRDVLAALPEFKTFRAAPTNSAYVSTSGLSADVGENYTIASGAGTFYTGLGSATTITRDGIINGARVVVTGAALADTTITPSLVNGTGAAATAFGGAPVRSGNTATFTLSNADADVFSAGAADLRVTQTGTAADQKRIAASQFTTSWTPVYASGFTAPTAAQAVVSGNITLDGTNFIAPWFSGSQAQTQSQVRLSNTGATNATVRVSITNGMFNFNGSPTAFGDASCATGAFTLPVNGDLVLSNSVIFQCFGAFLRGDLLISVEADGTGVTAKMRNTSPTGTFETTLGRYSGSTVAGAAQ